MQVVTPSERQVFTGNKLINSAAGTSQSAAINSFEVNGSLGMYTNPGAEKVTNGTFTGDATGWTLGAAWAYNANTVVKNADGTTTLAQDVSAVADEIYRVEYAVSGWSVGTVTVSVGGVSGTARGANGTYVEYITATGTGNLIFTPTNTARFTVDTVSVKKVGKVAADHIAAWVGDRIASGLEQAGKGSLFVRSEDGTKHVIGDRVGIGTWDPGLARLAIAGNANVAQFEVSLWIRETSGQAGSRDWSIGNASGAAYGDLAFHVGTTAGGAPSTQVFNITPAGVLTWIDGGSIIAGSTNGLKIGTATTQKIGIYNATPVVQGASVADASGGAIIDAEARTALNALLARVRAFGLIAT